MNKDDVITLPPIKKRHMRRTDQSVQNAQRPRVVEIARCCGAKFNRWRYEDGQFVSIIDSCHHCKKPLDWHRPIKPVQKPVTVAKPITPFYVPKPLTPMEQAWRDFKKNELGIT